MNNKGLKFKCFHCRKPITSPGALLFAPPIPPANAEYCEVLKFHICKKCYYKVFHFLTVR